MFERAATIDGVWGASRIFTAAATRVFIAATFVFLGVEAHAALWNTQADWSTVQNPTGVWSYGRKWTAAGDGFDLMPFRWHNPGAGGTGWYLGGTQWAPSVMDPIWALPGNNANGIPALPGNNANGIPAVRWTSPSDDRYDVDAIFTGADNRGVSVYTYVVLSGTVVWSDRIDSYLGKKTASLDAIFLAAGEHIDFITAWAGAGSPDWNWTLLDGTIQTAVPLPGSALLLLGTVPTLFAFRRRRACPPVTMQTS